MVTLGGFKGTNASLALFNVLKIFMIAFFWIPKIAKKQLHGKIANTFFLKGAGTADLPGTMDVSGDYIPNFSDPFYLISRRINLRLRIDF